jgi:hypothetical protein
MRKRVILLATVFGGLALLVCAMGLGVLWTRQAAERLLRMSHLKVIGLEIHVYYEANQKMPTGPDDLAPYLAGSTEMSRLRSGEIEIVWSAAPFADQKQPIGNIIMGWDTKLEPGNKRLVLFMDDQVDLMDEATFKVAPKPLLAK